MRKDVEEEPVMERMDTTPSGADIDELSDEDLLGAATLAKISSRQPVIDEEDEVAEVEIAKIEELIEDVVEFDLDIEEKEETFDSESSNKEEALDSESSNKDEE
jgi:hypothetical protein